MNPYESFVLELARLHDLARTYPLGAVGHPARARPESPAPSTGSGLAPRALIFSPHPDDEVIIGGLPLRLLRELRWNVINVAVTQGSNRDRQQERWSELSACCEHIGFGLVSTAANGLEGINLQSRAKSPEAWSKAVRRVAEILEEHQPRAIFFPHADDWNVTHIGTHHLVVEALGGLRGLSCLAVETEFWGAMKTPNLLVESSQDDVVDLITALSFHVGEVKRNPYHVRLPAWLMDNVRRGGEVVGGQGGVAPDFLFGTLYRLRRWSDGGFQPVLAGGRFVSRTDDLRPLVA